MALQVSEPYDGRNRIVLLQCGKRSYVWVDESWNIDPKFNWEFFTGYDSKWYANQMDDLYESRLYCSRS